VSKDGVDGKVWMISVELFIHNAKSRKHGKIKLYTELYTLSTENYVNLDKNEVKNKNKSFVNKF